MLVCMFQKVIVVVTESADELHPIDATLVLILFFKFSLSFSI